MKVLIEMFGWIGMLFILIAYAGVSFSLFDSGSVLFQSMNLVGALGVGMVSFYKKAYQPAMLNVVWGIIAISALLRIL